MLWARFSLKSDWRFDPVTPPNPPSPRALVEQVEQLAEDRVERNARIRALEDAACELLEVIDQGNVVMTGHVVVERLRELVP